MLLAVQAAEAVEVVEAAEAAGWDQASRLDFGPQKRLWLERAGQPARETEETSPRSLLARTSEAQSVATEEWAKLAVRRLPQLFPLALGREAAASA